MMSWSQSPDEDSLSSDLVMRITPLRSGSLLSQSPDEDSLSSDGTEYGLTIAARPDLSQSPDEDSLSSDSFLFPSHDTPVLASQSPDEDSLSSDPGNTPGRSRGPRNSLNPLTRIHCLPTGYKKDCLQSRSPSQSQSPDEDSLSSDPICALPI